MKIHIIFFSLLFALIFTVSAFGQGMHHDMNSKSKKGHDMSAMMGKPALDAKFDGIHMKAWIITQAKHKKLMDGKMGKMMMDGHMMDMKHDGKTMDGDMKGMDHAAMMGMDKATMDAMMSGTHHIMVDVKDIKTGELYNSATADVEIHSPMQGTSTVELKPMMHHFGNGIAFDKKGKYHITVNVIIDGVKKSKEFMYTVK